ncbi:hypothetical protein [Micromonospora sp. DT233]|uniref:hypothetical protein n=1 Tax=Micromonospora sp. DT233 TaxID=3393432 RepID=UPI003CF00BA7
MKDRWRVLALLAAALFAVNVAARVVVKLGFEGDDAAESRVSLAMFLAIGAILAGLVFRWGQHRSVANWGGDVAAAVGVALALTVLVGPLLVGQNPFDGGVATLFGEIGVYLVAAAVGVLAGHLTLTALGRDHRSRLLKRYAEIKTAKPRRPVRR